MKSALNEFKEFVNRGDVVTIAVGLIMALYFGKIVDALLDGVILPLVSAVFGEPNYENIGFDLGDARISIGLVINAIISFLCVAVILFLIIKAYNRYVVKPVVKTPGPTEVEILVEIRDALRTRT